MRRNLLITSSLLDSVHWLKTCPESWRVSAHQSLVDTLNKAPYVQSTWAKRGQEFEAMLNTYDGDNAQLCQVKQRIAGGLFQQKKTKLVTIDGTEYAVYGKCDYLFPFKIVDVKTSYKSKSKSKPEYYLDRSQHKVYSYLWGVDEFKYLVAHLGESMDNLFPFEVSVIPVKAQTTQAEIEAMISEFVDDLRELDLLDAYVNVYNGDGK